MKKLLVSVAVLGLVSPAYAHETEGVKCRAKIVKVTQESDHQIVKTRISVKNTTSTETSRKGPILAAGIFDSSGTKLETLRLNASPMMPGEKEWQWNVRKIAKDVDVSNIDVLHCHGNFPEPD